MDERQPYVIETDEETDTDLQAVLSDWAAPLGMVMANLTKLPLGVERDRDKDRDIHGEYLPILYGPGRQVSVVKRGKLEIVGKRGSGHGEQDRLSALFIDAYMQLCYSIRVMQPCHVLGICPSFSLLDDGVVEVLITATAYPTCMIPPGILDNDIEIHTGEDPSVALTNTKVEDEDKDKDKDKEIDKTETNRPENGDANGSTSDVPVPAPVPFPTSIKEEESIHLSSLEAIPGTVIKKYLGPVHLHFVKDGMQVRQFILLKCMMLVLGSCLPHDSSYHILSSFHLII
jgi:hypothetical protein